MADVFFMGRTGETMAVAAIALCGPVFSVFSAFNTLLGFGACTAASMALGRGEYQHVRQFTSFCLYSSLLVGSLSMAAVWIAMKPMLYLLGADEVTAPYAAAYLRVFALIDHACFLYAGDIVISERIGDKVRERIPLQIPEV